MAASCLRKTPTAFPICLLVPLDLSDSDHPRPGKVEPFLATPGIVEVDGAYSPDGRWVAYASSEAGEEGVYVRPSNPNAGGKRRISTGGGKFPVWSHDNRLFFLGGDDRIMVTTYMVSGDAINFATPHVWSDRQILGPQYSPEFRPRARRHSRRRLPPARSRAVAIPPRDLSAELLRRSPPSHQALTHRTHGPPFGTRPSYDVKHPPVLVFKCVVRTEESGWA